MERTERQTREKYMETRTKLAQLEGDAKNLHVTINQLEIQLTHSQKVRCFNQKRKNEEKNENRFPLIHCCHWHELNL